MSASPITILRNRGHEYLAENSDWRVLLKKCTTHGCSHILQDALEQYLYLGFSEANVWRAWSYLTSTFALRGEHLAAEKACIVAMRYRPGDALLERNLALIREKLQYRIESVTEHAGYMPASTSLHGMLSSPPVPAHPDEVETSIRSVRTAIGSGESFTENWAELIRLYNEKEDFVSQFWLIKILFLNSGDLATRRAASSALDEFIGDPRYDEAVFPFSAISSEVREIVRLRTYLGDSANKLEADARIMAVGLWTLDEVVKKAGELWAPLEFDPE